MPLPLPDPQLPADPSEALQSIQRNFEALRAAVDNQSSGGGGEAPPTGAVSAFAGSAAPTGWLLCDGSDVSRTTYSDLFAVVGTTYGAGDGSTTFGLPNLEGRVPVGLDAGQTEFDALAETGGSKLSLIHI